MYFDYKEVAQANAYLESVKSAMAECQRLLKELAEKLTKAIAQLKRVQDHMESALKPLQRKADDKRHERDRAISDFNYPIVQPYKWTVISDMSRVSVGR